MLCKYCEYDNPENASFCNQCGTPLFDEDIVSIGEVRARRRFYIIVIGIIALIVAAVILITSLITDLSSNVLGTWVATLKGTDSSSSITYSFTDKGGSNYHTDKSGASALDQVDFTWEVLDDKSLVIFWNSTNCIKYTWNPNFDNYRLSNNEYNWYLSGTKLYLSSASSEDGYQIFIKQER